MLVDLGRNDLGRVCRPGTVKVHDYRHIERYSHVMHLVSTVTGHLAEGKARSRRRHRMLPRWNPLGGAQGPCDAADRRTGTDQARYLRRHRRLPRLRRRRRHRDRDPNGIDQGTGSDTSRRAPASVADSDPVYEDTEARNKAMAVLSAIASAHTLRTIGGDDQ